MWKIVFILTESLKFFIAINAAVFTRAQFCHEAFEFHPGLCVICPLLCGCLVLLVKVQSRKAKKI